MIFCNDRSPSSFGILTEDHEVFSPFFEFFTHRPSVNYHQSINSINKYDWAVL